MRGRRAARVIIGVSVAAGMLSVVPTAVFAAAPACGDTLYTNTTLQADLDCSGYDGTALTLGANGITLDLNGHTITGFAGDDSDSGVYTEHNGDTITNGTIQNFNHAVDVRHARNTTVSWLNLIGEAADTNDVGAYVAYSVRTNVGHNTITGVYYGTYMYGDAQTAVNWNNSTTDGTNSSAAFWIEYGTRDSFSHNTASGSYGFSDYYSGGQTYTDNTANGGSQYGFYLYCDDYGHITLIGNTANGNTYDGFYTAYCYDYPPAAFVPSIIRGNTANNNGTNGFEDYYSVGARIKNNVAKTNGEDGFYLDYPSLQRIVGNVANHNTDSGIEFADNSGSSYGEPTTVAFNTLKYNNYGIYADYGMPDGLCHDNVIRHNTTAPTVGVNCT